MSDQPKSGICFNDIRGLLVDFGIPVIILAILSWLMATGIDSEVKTLMASVVGWMIKSGVSRKKGGS